MTIHHNALNARQTQLWLRSLFNWNQEEFFILALNSELDIISHECLFRGSIDQVSIHPREVFRWLILAKASQFIIAHNHPTGVARPSEQDIQVTQNILKNSKLMQIALVDHLILDHYGYYSFLEHGHLKAIRAK